MQEELLLPVAESAGTPLPSQMSFPRRILVVDPDPFMCHLSADLLIQQGYEVNATEDGALGWEELQTNDYNLVITGHKPPRLSGLKLVRKVQEVRPALPVVVVARKLPARERVQNPSLHIVAMPFKPSALEAVLITVRIVLDRPGIGSAKIPPLSNPPCQSSATRDMPSLQVLAPVQVFKQKSWEIHQRSGGFSYSGLNDW